MILDLKNVNIDNENEWNFVYDVEQYNANNRVGYNLTVVKNDDPYFAHNFVKASLDDQYRDTIDDKNYEEVFGFIKNMTDWFASKSIFLISASMDYDYTVLVNYVDGNVGFDYYHYNDLPTFEEFKKRTFILTL